MTRDGYGLFLVQPGSTAYRERARIQGMSLWGHGQEISETDRPMSGARCDEVT